MAYRIGKDSRLYRNGLGGNVRGGLISVSDLGMEEDTVCSDELLYEIERECNLRGFEGIVFDFERSPAGFAMNFIYHAAIYFSGLGMTVYVPEAFAQAAPSAVILISSAVTGGSCAESYRNTVLKYSPERLALVYEPICMDFIMPSPSGKDDYITQNQLDSLIAREHAVSYFSQELCAYYFTYRDSGSKSHFVLYDDENSMLKKLGLARDCGFKQAFLLYPEAYGVLDVLKEI
jgi:hypothetical protein